MLAETCPKPNFQPPPLLLWPPSQDQEEVVVHPYQQVPKELYPYIHKPPTDFNHRLIHHHNNNNSNTSPQSHSISSSNSHRRASQLK